MKFYFESSSLVFDFFKPKPNHYTMGFINELIKALKLFPQTSKQLLDKFITTYFFLQIPGYMVPTESWITY